MKGGERPTEVLFCVVAHHERQSGHHPCKQLTSQDTPAELQTGHLRESPLGACGDVHRPATSCKRGSCRCFPGAPRSCRRESLQNEARGPIMSSTITTIPASTPVSEVLLLGQD